VKFISPREALRRVVEGSYLDTDLVVERADVSRQGSAGRASGRSPATLEIGESVEPNEEASAEDSDDGSRRSY
jgi:hypothetical protein